MIKYGGHIADGGVASCSVQRKRLEEGGTDLVSSLQAAGVRRDRLLGQLSASLKLGSTTCTIQGLKNNGSTRTGRGREEILEDA